MKMRAAVLRKIGAPLSVERGIDVAPPRRGQVLVKVAYSGVCHSQLMETRGFRGEDRFVPHLLGHEGSGIVVAVGDEVTKVHPGDRVVLGWIKGEGLDVGGGEYRKDDHPINAGAVTTFNEYAVVSENRCVQLPPGVPMDVAVLFGCAVPTGAGIVMRQVRPAPGASMAFFGAGGIGLSALMASLLFDCSQRIVVDVNRDKLDLARQLGATHLIDPSREEPVAAIRSITQGLGVDHAVESAGLVTTIEAAFASVRKGGGQCVFASHPRHGETIRLDPHELISGKRIEGTWGGASVPDADIPRFAELYRSGVLRLDLMLTRRYQLDDVNAALADLESRQVARPLIVIDAELEHRSG